jgi:hypothetical protein
MPYSRILNIEAWLGSQPANGDAAETRVAGLLGRFRVRGVTRIQKLERLVRGHG